MMSNKLIAEMYELQQKGAKERTAEDRLRLSELKRKKSADDDALKKLRMKAEIGERSLRWLADSGRDDIAKKLTPKDDWWYAEKLIAKYRDEAEKEAAKQSENDDENQAQMSSETSAGVQPDQAQA